MNAALDAANALGILKATLQNRLTSPNFPEYLSKYHPKKNFSRTLIPCSVDGIEYRGPYRLPQTGRKIVLTIRG